MEYAVQNYRRRRHRSETLILIEEEILKLRVQELVAEVCVLMERERRHIQACFPCVSDVAAD